MSLPTKVEVVEVGTRDGLQNEKQYITPEDKIKLLDTITDAGVRRIEVTSFVESKTRPPDERRTGGSRRLQAQPGYRV